MQVCLKKNLTINTMHFNKPGISGRFWLIREILALTLKDLGSAAGVSYQSIKNIIDGETQNPGITLVGNVCGKWGISLYWMVYERGPVFTRMPDRRTIERAVELGITLDALVGTLPEVNTPNPARTQNGAADRQADLASMDGEINFLGDALRKIPVSAPYKEETHRYQSL